MSNALVRTGWTQYFPGTPPRLPTAAYSYSVYVGKAVPVNSVVYKESKVTAASQDWYARISAESAAYFNRVAQDSAAWLLRMQADRAAYYANIYKGQSASAPVTQYVEPNKGWTAAGNGASGGTAHSGYGGVSLGGDPFGLGLHLGVPTTPTASVDGYLIVNVPADPGSPGTPASVADVPPRGWTSYGRSISSVFRTGRARFKVNAVNGVVVGLSPTLNPSAGYGHIRHGLLFTNGHAYNVRTLADYGEATPEETFEVKATNETVTYLKDGAELASEASTFQPQALFMSAVMFAPLDSVADPELLTLTSGAGAAALPEMTVFAYEGTKAQGFATLPALTSIGSVFQKGEASLPAMQGLAVGGYASYGQGDQALPALAILAYGGTPVITPAPFSATSLPIMIAAAHGVTGEVGQGSATLPVLDTLAGRLGQGVANATLPALGTVAYSEPRDAAYMMDGLGVFELFMPENEITVVIFGNVAASSTLSSTTLQDALLNGVMSIQGTLVFDAIMDAVMHAIASMGGTLGSPVIGSEAYAVNVDNNATTQYTGYAFNSFCEIGGRFYGASDQGLYLLEGSTDAGDAIRARVSFGKLSFGTATKKTVSEAYIGMSAQGNLFIKVIAEGAEYTYKTRSFSAEMQQQRVTFGKGLRTNYVTLELYNENGADFEIDTVELRVADLTRRI